MNSSNEYVELKKKELFEISEDIEFMDEFQGKDEIENHNLYETTSKLAKSSIPAILGLFMVIALETVNIVMIGRFNDPLLISAIGIGTLYVNTTGIVPGIALLGGIETLCSHAFGQKNLKMVAAYASIGRATVIAFFLLITVPLNFMSYRILLLIGISEEISGLATYFCHAMSICVFFALQYSTSLKYLQSMNLFMPGCIITVVTGLIHPLWAYLFIYVFDLDIVGAGLAMGVTQFIGFVTLSIYIHLKNPYPESNFTYYFDKITFTPKYIWEYLVKAVPAAILYSADWIGFEILTFMASFLGESALAANICMFNFISLIFMTQLGISIATTTLVGNSIGAENIHNAKNYVISSLLLGVGVMSIATSLVMIFRHEIPLAYTSNIEVNKAFDGLLFIYLFFSIPDAIQVQLSGVLKGLGKQKWGSIITLIVLFPVNISLAYYLAFSKNLGLSGLWYSQLTSVIILALGNFCVYLRVDYVDVIKEMKKSVELHHKKHSEHLLAEEQE